MMFVLVCRESQESQVGKACGAVPVFTWISIWSVDGILAWPKHNLPRTLDPLWFTPVLKHGIFVRGPEQCKVRVKITGGLAPVFFAFPPKPLDAFCKGGGTGLKHLVEGEQLVEGSIIQL